MTIQEGLEVLKDRSEGIPGEGHSPGKGRAELTEKGHQEQAREAHFHHSPVTGCVTLGK